MFEKFLSILERIAVALENGTGEQAAPAPSTRGRKAKGEVNGVAVSPEQLAAAAAAAAPAASQTAQVSQAAAATAAAPAAAATVAEKPVEVVPTLQQVADAIIDLANNHSRDAAVGILAKFNVKKVPELKPEQFASVLAAVAAAKAPALNVAAAGLV